MLLRRSSSRPQAIAASAMFPTFPKTVATLNNKVCGATTATMMAPTAANMLKADLVQRRIAAFRALVPWVQRAWMVAASSSVDSRIFLTQNRSPVMITVSTTRLYSSLAKSFQATAAPRLAASNATPPTSSVDSAMSSAMAPSFIM